MDNINDASSSISDLSNPVITTKTTNVFQTRTTFDRQQYKTFENKFYALNAWMGSDLMSCVKLCQTNQSSPSEDFFKSEYEKAKISVNGPIISVPDLFIRVRGDDKNTENHYTGFLVHSVIFGSICPLLQAHVTPNGNENQKWYFAQMWSEDGLYEWSAKHFSKLIRFVYNGELKFHEDEKEFMEKMAEDCGIEEFAAAVESVKNSKERHLNNPFNNNKGENKNKNTKKEFKNKKENSSTGGKFKSVGKNGNNGKNGLKETMENMKTMVEFIKMMKN